MAEAFNQVYPRGFYVCRLLSRLGTPVKRIEQRLVKRTPTCQCAQNANITSWSRPFRRLCLLTYLYFLVRVILAHS